MLTEDCAKRNLPPGGMVSSSAPGVTCAYLPPSRLSLAILTELSVGSLTEGSMEKVTSAAKVSRSRCWPETVPILMPLIRTSSPTASPPILSNSAVTS